MYGPLIYILKSMLITGTLILYYYAVWRNTRHHRFNRVYLLSAAIAGLLLPIFRFGGPGASWAAGYEPAVNVLPLLERGYMHATSPLAGQYGRRLLTVLESLVLLTGISLFLQMLFSILRIYKARKQFPLTRYPEYTFIDSTLEEAPFSFFRYLFWQRKIGLGDPGAELIIRHELAHIRGGHSFDKLLCQVLVCFFWFNPFYRLIRRELAMIHEYIADEEAAGAAGVESLAQMLLLAHGQRGNGGVSLAFLQSPIGKRLAMIRGEYHRPGSYLRLLMPAPVIGCLWLLLAFSPGRSAAPPAAGGRQMVVEIRERKRLDEFISLHPTDAEYRLDGIACTARTLEGLRGVRFIRVTVSTGVAAGAVGSGRLIEVFTR
jgi:hypothetical protein